MTCGSIKTAEFPDCNQKRATQDGASAGDAYHGVRRATSLTSLAEACISVILGAR